MKEKLYCGIWLLLYLSAFGFLVFMIYSTVLRDRNTQYEITSEDLECGDWQSRLCLDDEYIYFSKDITKNCILGGILFNGRGLKLDIVNGGLYVTLVKEKTMYSDFKLENRW